ncbi:bile acid:sodium symporter family protein [Microbulbifer sp. 2205BS26-8]|uniref:bile acid:sodium symporter family protein n=1 Tax=Microbulbifer sp. 2205BS26-8 TaxID=3064386 RepID=UPI0027400B25|nr:bile acid:sodium symporter family protein [Microbulbifer sp. 2205BS26-8]MDP5210226.1 bile acid:sodium symporter family protein [Microbulbifer sp. 2205BS26-8]
MESGPMISIGLPIALFIIMVGIGMTLTVRDFHHVAVRPRGLLLGTIIQIILLPFVAFTLCWALSLPAEIAVGLVIIAACPGGTTSNLFTLLARGNVALSIVLTVSASLITILSLPFFTNYALRTYFGAEQEIVLPFVRTVVMLSVIVLLPVVLGMLVRAWNPPLASRAESIVSIFGALVLLILVVQLVWGMRERIGELMSQAGPSVILLNLSGIFLGLVFSRIGGLPLRDGLAVATELGIKNGTIGLMVTLTLLHSREMSIPSAVYGVVMFPMGMLLVLYGRKKAREVREVGVKEVGEAG